MPTNTARKVPASGGDPLVDEICYDQPAPAKAPPDNASESKTGPQPRSDLDDAVAQHGTIYP
jgi:hypothetical protein